MLGIDHALTDRQYHLRWLFAIGFIISMIGGSFFLSKTIQRLNIERVQYPQSEMRSRNKIGRFYPRATKTDYVFHSTDPFPDIYRWYSRNFGFGAEQEAVGSCVFVATDEPVGELVETVFTMTMCNTPQGNLIYFSEISRGPY